MSRRFGRNQKRRMRQELAEAGAKAERFEQAYKMSDGLTRHLRDRAEQAESWVRTLREMIEPEHVANELSTIEVRNPLDGTFRVAPRMRLSSDYFYGNDERISPSFVDETIALLETKEGYDRQARQVHFRVSLGRDIAMAYGISETALATMSKRHLLEMMTKELARALMPAIEKHYRSKA